MPLENALLYHFVRDALRPYSENFRVTDRQNPTKFFLNGSPYSTRISYVHDSGNARPDDDEVRIQISRNSIEIQRDRPKAGAQVAFIGFFEGGKIFVAWDQRMFSRLRLKRQSLFTRVSLRSRGSKQTKLLSTNFSQDFWKDPVSRSQCALAPSVFTWKTLSAFTDCETRRRLLDSWEPTWRSLWALASARVTKSMSRKAIDARNFRFSA